LFLFGLHERFLGICCGGGICGFRIGGLRGLGGFGLRPNIDLVGGEVLAWDLVRHCGGGRSAVGLDLCVESQLE
jgi:hypothetical protein